MVLRRPSLAILFVVGLLNAVLAMSLSGCNKPATPAAGPGPAAQSVGNPLTDEECQAVGAAITKAVSSGDADALDQLIDWDAICQRSTDGIDAPDAFRKGFLSGLTQSMKSKGLTHTIVDVVKKGGSYTMLRSHVQEKRRWLLFRLLLPEAGLNYHDLLLARRPDGKVKVVDMYIYLSGEPLSQTFRRGYIQTLSQTNSGLIGRLTGEDQKFTKYFTKLGEMSRASQSGQFAQAMEIYKSLPDDVKNERNVLLIRLQIAQGLGNDAEYAQSIEDYRKTYPNDACIEFLSIDYFLLKKQYRECLDCIDRLDRAVEGDPYLQINRANVYLEQNDLAAARAAVKKAIDADPGLIAAYWTLASISLKDNNYDETLQTLRLIRDKFEIEIGDLTTEPTYKGFTESPQYQEWLKDKTGATVGKDSKK